MQREGGGNETHVIDRGLARLSDAPTRVGRKRLQITARPFGIEHAECERAFARTRHARDAHKLAERNVHVHVLQIVHARTAHLDMVDILHDFLFWDVPGGAAFRSKRQPDSITLIVSEKNTRAASASVDA